MLMGTMIGRLIGDLDSVGKVNDWILFILFCSGSTTIFDSSYLSW